MKAYMIVTNDELELPVKMDIFGAKPRLIIWGSRNRHFGPACIGIHGAGKHIGIRLWLMKMPR